MQVSVRRTDRRWGRPRSGELLAALTAFAADGTPASPGGELADVGASTRRLHRVLLTHGAASIAAVDGPRSTRLLDRGSCSRHRLPGVSVRGLDPLPPWATAAATSWSPTELHLLTMVMSDLAALCAPAATSSSPSSRGSRSAGSTSAGAKRRPVSESCRAPRSGCRRGRPDRRTRRLRADPQPTDRGVAAAWNHLLWLRPCLPRRMSGMPWHAPVERAERLAAPSPPGGVRADQPLAPRAAVAAPAPRRAVLLAQEVASMLRAGAGVDVVLDHEGIATCAGIARGAPRRRHRSGPRMRTRLVLGGDGDDSSGRTVSHGSSVLCWA